MSAKKKPKAKKPVFKLPKLGKPNKKVAAKKKPAQPQRPRRSATVEQKPMSLRFQIVDVQEATDDAGAIVRKTVEASGPRGAVMQFESNNRAHHDLLEEGKFFDVTLKEVPGFNA